MSNILELGKEMKFLESLSFKRINFESKSRFTFEEQENHIKYMFAKNHYHSFKTNFDVEKEIKEIENFIDKIFELLTGSRDEDILLAIELCKGFKIPLGNFFLQHGYHLKSLSYHWMKPSNHYPFFKGETIDFEKNKNIEKAIEPVEYQRKENDIINFQKWCMLRNMESVINKLERFDHKIKRVVSIYNKIPQDWEVL